MPVEIREMVIRATITDRPDDDDASKKAITGKNFREENELVIEDTIEQILDILKLEKER